MKKTPVHKKPGAVSFSRSSSHLAVTPIPVFKAYYFIIGILAALLYASTLTHDYTVDDGTVMENNKIVKQGIRAIPEIFTTRYRAGFWDRKENLYRPLSLVMFAAEWQLSNGRPWLGHLVNIVMYALVCLALFLLFRKLLIHHHPFAALAATLFFTVHPLHTEVVANIKSRDELLCLFFSVLAMQAALHYGETRRNTWLLACGAMFFMALLSKENAVAMVVIIPLMLWFFSVTNLRSLLWPTLTLVFTLSVYLAIRISVLGGLHQQAELQVINNSLLAAEGFSRFMMAIYLLGKYLWMQWVPHPLSFDYSYNQIKTTVAASPQAWLALLFLAAMMFWSVSRLKTRNPYAFCILFFFGTIFLVSNLVFLIEATFAERFAFMPSAGTALAVGIFIGNRIPIRKERNLPFPISEDRLLMIALVLVLVVYSILTINRNRYWKDNLTLLAKDVKTCAESARIRYAYGSAILIEQALKESDPTRKSLLLDQAVFHLEKGVSILNTYADAFYHLALAYKEKGDTLRAIQAFESAKRSKTWNDADFYLASGLTYGAAGRYAQAFHDLHRANELRPSSAEVLNNIGMYMTEAGHTDSAIFYLNQALALDSLKPRIFYNLGNALARQGRYHDAISQYAKAIALDSLYEDAYNNTGNCFAALNQHQQALYYYEKVLEWNPNNTKVINNIAVTYFILGDTARAKMYMDRIKK